MSEFNHATLSPWGYLIDAESVPNFITDLEFAQFTNGKFGTDMRIAATIPSATEAIRNFCGWHIAPELTCGMVYNVHDLRDAFVGHDLLVQLPATYVSGIQKIVLNAAFNSSSGFYEGDETEDYEIGMGGGLLRIYDVGYLDRKSKIFIKYTAGFPNTPSAIKELTADRISHALTNPYGVTSEAAGGVSVSYSGVWAGSSNSSSLPSDVREILEAYKVKGVF